MDKHEALSHCPLCALELTPLRVVALARFDRDHLVRCTVCGLVFSRLTPSADDYARVYSSYDYAAEDAARTALNRQRERELVERLLPYRMTGNVLDVAAGAGRFLERFQECGFTCYATEFDERLEQRLRDKGFETLPGGTAPQASAGTFDIIIFTEIIEHIHNPIPVLRSLFQLLRPGGCVYVTTPNFNALERHLMGSEWGMICWPEHITYWTSHTLAKAFGKTGFRKRWQVVENVSPFRILQALKRGRLGGLIGNVSEQAFSDRAQDKVAGSRILSLLKRIVNSGLNVTRLGSSIKAIYEKPAA